MSKHHPSCRPSDSSLIRKCDQCGLETPAEMAITEQIQGLNTQINRIMNERDDARRQLALSRETIESLELRLSMAASIDHQKALARLADSQSLADSRLATANQLSALVERYRGELDEVTRERDEARPGKHNAHGRCIKHGPNAVSAGTIFGVSDCPDCKHERLVATEERARLAESALKEAEAKLEQAAKLHKVMCDARDYGIEKIEKAESRSLRWKKLAKEQRLRRRDYERMRESASEHFDLLRKAEAENAALRRKIEEKYESIPPDIQETVIRQLNLVSRDAVTRVKEENAALRAKLAEANNRELEHIDEQAAQAKIMNAMRERLEYIRSAYCDTLEVAKEFADKALAADAESKQGSTNFTVYCWFCKKDTTGVDALDACCHVCHRPFKRSRCDEFGYNDDGTEKKPDAEAEAKS